MVKVRADEIKHALSKRHSDDFFITEVKNGPTHAAARGELLIIDAMAIKKSWAHPCITAYEVKVDRQDFIRDEKWHGYLAYCHQFYFVCPKGLIEPEEVPKEVGLIYYNPEKGSLTTKKKAVYRHIDIPRDLLYYVIMTRLESDRYPFFRNRREYFQAYVEDRANLKALGYMVKSKLGKQLSQLIEENERLKREIERNDYAARELRELRNVLSDLGFKVYSWNLADELRNAFRYKQSPKVLELAERMKRDAEKLYELTVALHE